jgi:hypothetical protein
VNKKRLLTAVFISALLSSTLVGTTLVTLGNANPYIKGGNKPLPEKLVTVSCLS